MLKLNLRSRFDAVYSKYDRFMNALNGLGGNNDPIVNARLVQEARLTQVELDAFYRFDWVARKGIDVIPQDALRQGFDIEGLVDEPDILEGTKKRMRLFDAHKKILRAMTMARLYGGAVIFVGVDDGSGKPEEPLLIENVQSVKFLTVVDRWQLVVNEYYNDILTPDYGQPMTYRVIPRNNFGTGGGSIKTNDGNPVVHESRLVRFDSLMTPELGKITNDSWDDPLLTGLIGVVKHFQVASQSGAIMFQDFVTKVFKVKGLIELIASDEEGTNEALQARLRVLQQSVGIHNVMAIDLEEEYEKKQHPITGFDKLLSMYMDIVAGAFDIPRSRFFSQQLGKLAGASESTKEYYDKVARIQKFDLTNPVERLVKVFVSEQNGDFDNTSIKWRPLWQDDNETKATIRKTQAEADEKYFNMGVLHPEEIRQSRFGGEEFSTDTELDEKLEAEFNQLTQEPLEPEEDDDPSEEGN